ncbi:hypothetical protein BXY66_0489 [Shimia isoporae]|uniref:Uncharacterized protein n=1 Tax=Shimia isoporae TaxID=647720 RepID=A0A4R1NTW1_9RHOB|nr:hypothetical protein [Shimia isoporae]TCL08452.1 hypothetical protein BXY66_0489 [Shimia isoporae]
MEQIANSLGKFVYRDLLYVIAGLICLTAYAWTYQPTPPENLPLQELTFGGIAYVVGFVSQEIFSVLQIVCLREVSVPSKAWSIFNLAAKLDQSVLKGMTQQQLLEAKVCYRSQADIPELTRSQISRYIILKDIAGKFGSALLMSALIQIPYLLWMDGPKHTAASFFLLCLFLGAFLAFQSYFRANQVAWYMVSFVNKMPKN